MPFLHSLYFAVEASDDRFSYCSESPAFSVHIFSVKWFLILTQYEIFDMVESLVTTYRLFLFDKKHLRESTVSFFF